mgnify:FL=1
MICVTVEQQAAKTHMCYTYLAIIVDPFFSKISANADPLVISR